MAEKEVGQFLLEQLTTISLRVKDMEKRKDNILNVLKKESPENLAKVFISIGNQTLEEEASSGLFVMLLDSPALVKRFGASTFNQLTHQLQTSTRMSEIMEVLNQFKTSSGGEVLLLQARFNVWLQLCLLLDYRLSESGYPALNREISDIFKLALRDLDMEELQIYVQRQDFPESSWAMLEIILEEADFIKTEDQYELSLSEDAIVRLAAGGTISSSQRGHTVASRLSDAMMARQAENLVKRLILAVRGFSMYPLDHPGLPPLISSFQVAIEALLSANEVLVMTAMAGKLRINHIQIRTQSKLLTEFMEGMEERHISSVTFMPNITIEEIKHLLSMFIQGVAWLKDQGGAKQYLSSQGVIHIAIDQYRYGIIDVDGKIPEGFDPNMEEVVIAAGIAGAGTVKAASPTPAKINPDLLLLNEIVFKVAGGEDLGSMSDDEVGSLFKKILSGKVEESDKMKQSLAELVVSLDPQYLERAIIDQPEIRRRMSWTVSRKIVAKALEKLNSDDIKVRLGALAILGQVAELAVLREKTTTVRQILAELSNHILHEDPDEDTWRYMIEILAQVLRQIILSGNFKMAHSFLDEFRKNLDETAAMELSEDVTSKIDNLEKLFVKVSEPDVVKVLVKKIEAKDRETAERALDILQNIGTDEVVTQLLEVFVWGTRRARGRAFNSLIKMPRTAGDVMSWRLKSLNDRDEFPRQESNPNLMMDESWYRARNALGVLAEVWHPDAEPVFLEAHKDADPRIRKEILTVLIHANRKILPEIARNLLNDADFDVKSLAIKALSSPDGQSAVSTLTDIFFLDSRLRKNVVETMAAIRSTQARDFLLEALRFKDKNIRKIYLEDPQLHQTAIRALSAFKTHNELDELKRFQRDLRNPLMYIFHYPLGWVFRSRQIASTVRETIGRLQAQVGASKTQ